MRHLAVLACWAACVARVWVTFIRGPRPIWRVSLTLSLLCVTFCATARYETGMVFGSPGLPEAVSYFWLLLGVGMVNIYVDCLWEEEPTWRKSWWHIALSGFLAITVLVAWNYIPLKGPGNVLGTAPMSPALATFMLVAYVPLVPTLGRVSHCCFAQLKNPTGAPAPGQRVGLSLIGVFCGIGMLSFGATSVDVLFRIPTHARRSPDHPLISVTPIANAISLCGLSLGLFFFLAGPWVAAKRQRRQAELIRPLWDFLIARYPAVHLAPTNLGEGAPLMRMTMEVHDALSLCRLPVTTSITPEAIVNGILSEQQYENTNNISETISAAQLVTEGDVTDIDLAAAYNAKIKELKCMSPERSESPIYRA